MALVADDLVAVLLGPKWSAAVPVLRALCVYAGVRAIDVLLPPVLFARRRERFMFWYCFALLILMPVAALLGAVWNGALGTVIVATPVYCTVMAVMARETLAEMETGFAELWAVLRSIMTATVIMSAAVLLLREAGLEGWVGSSLLRLLLLVASGGLVYIGALFCMDDPVIAIGYKIIGRILHCRSTNPALSSPVSSSSRL
jgi:O-antigen/teichoic acid export membrane protein